MPVSQHYVVRYCLSYSLVRYHRHSLLTLLRYSPLPKLFSYHGLYVTLSSLSSLSATASVFFVITFSHWSSLLYLHMCVSLLCSSLCSSLYSPLCSPLFSVQLPYNLTVPFARFVALNKITALRRYVICHLSHMNSRLFRQCVFRATCDVF